MKTIRQIKVADKDLDKVQTNILRVLGPISKTLIIDGVQLTGVKTMNGTFTVNHTLARQPQGYIIVDIVDFIQIKRVSWDDKQIVLQANGVTTVSLWIY